LEEHTKVKATEAEIPSLSFGQAMNVWRIG